MTATTNANHPVRDQLNLSVLGSYTVAGALLYAIATVLVYLQWRPLVAFAMIAAPVAVWIVSQPRIALSQFVFCLFIRQVVIDTGPIYLIDLSAVLLVLAAFVDLLRGESAPQKISGLFYHFLWLILAVFLAAILSYDFASALRPLARLVTLAILLLAMIRLVPHAGVRQLLKLFFWLGVAHGLLVLGPAVASGGVVRSFGLSRTLYDDLAMMALPIGTAFYLWAPDGKARWYLPGLIITFLALLATQSRAPIAFGLFAIAAVGLVSLRRAHKVESSDSPRLVKDRIKWVMILGLTLSLAAPLISPGLFEALVGRFERLWTSAPGGTFAIRLVLWKSALAAFADNPLVGIGPGMFRSLPQLYPALHLNPLHWYVQTLSAHNLVLHYLAETGLVGATGLVALFVGQFQRVRRVWKAAIGRSQTAVAAALWSVGLLLLLTTLIEAGWMWGQTGYLLVFFLGLIAVQYRMSAGQAKPDPKISSALPS